MRELRNGDTNFFTGEISSEIFGLYRTLRSSY